MKKVSKKTKSNISVLHLPRVLCAWEKVRLNNINEGKALMLKLGLIEPVAPKVQKVKKPKKVNVSAPVRKSERLVVKKVMTQDQK